MKKFEESFKKIHDNSLNIRIVDPIQKHVDLLEEMSELSKDLLSVYARTRFFIRLKYLNNSIEVFKKNQKR